MAWPLILYPAQPDCWLTVYRYEDMKTGARASARPWGKKCSVTDESVDTGVCAGQVGFDASSPTLSTRVCGVKWQHDS